MAKSRIVELLESRPHGALEWATPAEFARCCREAVFAVASKEPEISTAEQFSNWYTIRLGRLPDSGTVRPVY